MADRDTATGGAGDVEGSPDATARTGGDPHTPAATTDERAPNTLLNALIGGVVTVVLSFIPFSPVLGGGVAAYLEGGDTRDGAKVGGLAGIIAMVPLVFLGFIMLFFIPIIGPRGAIGLLILFVFVLALLAFYTVGLSVLGGVLGIYIKNETDL